MRGALQVGASRQRVARDVQLARLAGLAVDSVPQRQPSRSLFNLPGASQICYPAMAVSLSTEDKLEYQFFPVSGEQLQFRIKAPHDAHIALTSGPCENDPMWEVFIGGWKNSKSVIRKNRAKPDVTEVDTPDFLTSDEFRGFWIRWAGGYLTVGKEGEPEPFLSYVDPDPFPITHFGVCTGWGASGEWLLEAGPTPTAPSDYQIGGSSCWCDATNGLVPPGAVLAGEDGEPLYVARANHEGALVPGKLVPSHGVCYLPYGGEEHTKSEYQVLCNCEPLWVPVSGGDIPPNAVPAGQTEDGEPLFVGRTNHEGTLTPGKVHPSHGCLYIPYGGQEVSFSDYEVLTN